MKIKIVGYKKVDYLKKETNQRVVGCNYYYTTELTAHQSEGLQVGEFYLSEEKINALGCVLKIGEEYDAYFNQWKRIEMLLPVVK